MKKQSKYLVIGGAAIVAVAAVIFFIRGSDKPISEAELNAAMMNGTVDYNNPEMRKAVLASAIADINKTTPMKVDPVTTLLSVTTDHDRAITYNYQLDTTPPNFESVKPMLEAQLKSYWCDSPQTAENRKMGIIANYSYVAADTKKEFAHLSLNTKDCAAK